MVENSAKYWLTKHATHEIGYALRAFGISSTVGLASRNPDVQFPRVGVTLNGLKGFVSEICPQQNWDVRFAIGYDNTEGQDLDYSLGTTTPTPLWIGVSVFDHSTALKTEDRTKVIEHLGRSLEVALPTLQWEDSQRYGNVWPKSAYLPFTKQNVPSSLDYAQANKLWIINLFVKGLISLPDTLK
jgi:hypothetical protein